jgi:hypothetical protein
LRNAANSDKGAEAWQPVLATIRQAPRINVRSETGDTALHFAAGGEGTMSSAGEYIQVRPQGSSESLDVLAPLFQEGLLCGVQ